MTAQEIDSDIKIMFRSLRIECAREENQAICALSSKLASVFKKELNEAKKKMDSAGSDYSDKMQFFLDNPLTPEEEAKRLRAMLHVGIDSGNIPPMLLEKLDKIIGVHSEDDNSIQTVQFGDAFPDLHTAKEVALLMIKNQMAKKDQIA